MATESGVEGRARAGSEDMCVSNWTLESNPNLQEDTCGTTGGHTHRAMVKKDHKLTATVFVSSGKQPEEIGIVEGSEVDMDLRVGTLKAYMDWTFIIDTVTLKGADNNGLVTFDVVMYAQENKPSLTTWS